MPLPGFLKNIFAGGAGELIKNIGDAADKIFTSKEEKEAFKQEMVKEVNRNIERMTELSTAETEAYLRDVQSARGMQAEALKQEDKFSKRFVYYLAATLIFLTFVFDMLFFFVSYPERNHDIINMTAGVLNSVGFSAVVSFFFGSSKSSHDKQQQINELKG